MNKNAAPRWTEEQLRQFNQNKTKQLIDKNRAATQPLPKRNPFDQPVQKNTDLFGKAVPVKQAKKKKGPAVVQTSPQKDWWYSQVTYWAKENGMSIQREVKFDTERRFRFDLYIAELKLGLEWNGIMSKKSRHLTIEGYSTDMTKANLAQSNGLRYYQYTILNYKEVLGDLNRLNSKLKR